MSGAFRLNLRVFILISVHDLMLFQIGDSRESSLADLAGESFSFVNLHMLDQAGMVQILFVALGTLEVFLSHMSAQVIV